MMKMELSLGEREPVNDLIGCERWEADSHGSDRNGGQGSQGGIGSSSRRRSNSYCSDIIHCRGHQ